MENIDRENTSSDLTKLNKILFPLLADALKTRDLRLFTRDGDLLESRNVDGFWIWLRFDGGKQSEHAQPQFIAAADIREGQEEYKRHFWGHQRLCGGDDELHRG